MAANTLTLPGGFLLRRIAPGQGSLICDGQRVLVSHVAMLHRRGQRVGTGWLLWRFAERRLRFYLGPGN